MNDICRAWLEVAKDDLDTVEILLDNENLTNIASFHTQQCIEKSLKAVIEYKKIKVPKSHNLERLYESVKDKVTIDDTVLLETLDELYIDARYPADFGLLPHGKPSTEELQQFYCFAKHVYTQAYDILKM